MNEDEEMPLTMSREALSELAWSKPMRELAKDFGISDVALANCFRRLATPVPGHYRFGWILPDRLVQQLSAGEGSEPIATHCVR